MPEQSRRARTAAAAHDPSCRTCGSVALLARSPWFRQGEALFAGGFVPTPSLVKVNARLTPEGGSDVSVPLR